MSSKVLFVYGTLKRGHGLNSILNECPHLSDGTLSGFMMYSLGGFPYILECPDKEMKIHGELYYLDGQYIMDAIDDIEFGAGFHKIQKEIKGENGEMVLADVYVYKQYTTGELIEDGKF